MIDFIIRYWMEILFTTTTSGVLYMFKEYVGLKNGLKALLKNEMVRIYEQYSHLGYCSSYMKENIGEMYKNYHKLGGNGYATSMVNEIYKLPSNLKDGDGHEEDIK